MTISGYSLANRLSLHLAWQALVGLGLLCGSIFAATVWSFGDKQDAHLAVKLAASRDLATTVERESGVTEMRRQLQAAIPRRAGTYLELRGANGELLYHDPEKPHDLAYARRVEFEQALTLGFVRGVMFLDTTDDMRMLRRLALILVAATLLGGLTAGAAGVWQVRRTLQPLRHLAEQTRSVTPGRMNQRLSLVEPVAELQPWIDQFNAMLRRLEAAYVQFEAFNADVAHELRTPLAALMGHTEVALSRERSVEFLRETLAGNLEELHRLSALVSDMLFLSRADRGATARRGAPVSMRELIDQVVEFHDAQLSEAQLRVHLEGDAVVAVDEALVKRAVSNLLGNATRYAEAGSAITVHVCHAPEGLVEIAVANSGPDIAPAHMYRLFDRFFRVDESRVDALQHHGLGLAIVAAIARMHAGRTTAASGEGRTRVGFVVSPSGS